jgi:NAD(P)-dependent dehydrogenase (short-subunit alcohol dehydrogenase family)
LALAAQTGSSTWTILKLTRHSVADVASNPGETITAEDVLAGIDLGGKRALVTGVSSGIGAATAQALVARGAAVVGTARVLTKAEKVAATLRDVATSSGSFDLVELDLACFASVRACADRLTEDGQPFDFVIANAGIMASPFGLTTDGFETQLGTNHLGHFLLVNRIARLWTKSEEWVGETFPLPVHAA